VKGFVYSRNLPTPLNKNPRILALSEPALQLVGLDSEEILKNEESKREYAELLCGNRLLKDSIPISHNYCGHQFGYFAG
jgi:serine/tyrosine/threonine adenylyltransferase